MRQHPLLKVTAGLVIIGTTLAIAIQPTQAEISARRARQSEAKQYTGTLVRAQQAYYLENSKFTDDRRELGRIVHNDTTDYRYSMKIVGKNLVQINATAKLNGLNNYFGFVIAKEVTPNEWSTEAAICESTRRNAVIPQLSPSRSSTQCPTGYTNLGGR